MEFRKVNMATARIRGLKKGPYYFEHHCYYAWDIKFDDASTLWVNHISFIPMGDSMEEAEREYKRVVGIFGRARIQEKDKVALLFADPGNVLAIGKIGDDVWIDVRDHFTRKPFKDLIIVIKSLMVY